MAKDELIAKTRNILLLKITGTQNHDIIVRDKIVSTYLANTAEILEVIKGEEYKVGDVIPLSNSQSLPYEDNNFNGHTQPIFWNATDQGRAQMGICSVDHTFRLNGVYLLFLEPKGSSLAAEIIPSKADKWYQYVKSKVADLPKIIPAPDPPASAKMCEPEQTQELWSCVEKAVYSAKPWPASPFQKSVVITDIKTVPTNILNAAKAEIDKILLPGSNAELFQYRMANQENYTGKEKYSLYFKYSNLSIGIGSYYIHVILDNDGRLIDGGGAFSPYINFPTINPTTKTQCTGSLAEANKIAQKNGFDILRSSIRIEYEEWEDCMHWSYEDDGMGLPEEREIVQTSIPMHILLILNSLPKEKEFNFEELKELFLRPEDNEENRAIKTEYLKEYIEYRKTGKVKPWVLKTQIRPVVGERKYIRIDATNSRILSWP